MDRSTHRCQKVGLRLPDCSRPVSNAEVRAYAINAAVQSGPWDAPRHKSKASGSLRVCPSIELTGTPTFASFVVPANRCGV